MMVKPISFLIIFIMILQVMEEQIREWSSPTAVCEVKVLCFRKVVPDIVVQRG